MIRIISDTSTLYSPAAANESGFDVAPLSVSFGAESYLEYQEITTLDFIKKIQEGFIPSSSQPSVGTVLDLYEEYPDDTIINISMSDGLSGTYQSACMAAGMSESPDRITVINSNTLCGPQRFIVEEAVHMAKNNASREQIIDRVNTLIHQTDSFLIPSDLDFLMRGGRLSPLAGHLGKLVRMVPVMTLSKDCKQLVRFAIKRSHKNAVESVGSFLKEKYQSKSEHTPYVIYICHSCAEELAVQTQEQLLGMGIEAEFIITLLSPVFSSHGGPGCIAIQAIKK